MDKILENNRIQASLIEANIKYLEYRYLVIDKVIKGEIVLFENNIPIANSALKTQLTTYNIPFDILNQIKLNEFTQNNVEHLQACLIPLKKKISKYKSENRSLLVLYLLLNFH